MTEKKTMDVQVKSLQKGDVILRVKDLNLVTFQSFGVRKPVNWTLDCVDLNGTTHYSVAVRNDAVLTVERQVETEAEKAARKHEIAMHGLRTLEVTWNRGALARLGKIVDAARENEDHYPELITYSNLDDILQDQAKAKIMRNVRHLYENPAERFASLNDDERLVNAFALVFLDITEARSYNRDPLSRSTSVLSNIIEDVEAWARREFVQELTNGFTGYAAGELVRARAADLMRDRDARDR